METLILNSLVILFLKEKIDTDNRTMEPVGYLEPS